MKQQMNARISKLTAEQLAALVTKTGMNQAEVISVAIDRMFNKEIEMDIKIEYGTFSFPADAGGVLFMESAETGAMVSAMSNRGKTFSLFAPKTLGNSEYPTIEATQEQLAATVQIINEVEGMNEHWSVEQHPRGNDCFDLIRSSSHDSAQYIVSRRPIAVVLKKFREVAP